MRKKAAKHKYKKLEVHPPQLFKRGKKGIYYLRLRTKDKDIWVSTKTSDRAEVDRRVKQIVDSKFKAAAEQATEDKKLDRDRKIIEAVVKTVSGEAELSTIRLDTCYKRWTNVCPSYSSLDERTKKNYNAAFSKFVSWCTGKGIEFIEHVTRVTALEYSKHLWDSKLSGKTYNDHLKLISRIFSTIDATTPLPYRDPFNRIHIPRKKKSESGAEGHQALEPDMLKSVIEESAKHGQDYRDLIILGSQSGLRLQDAALLKWNSIHDDFIEVVPGKTRRTGNKARIPITATLRNVIDARKERRAKDGYLIPSVAEHYKKNPHYVTKTCKSIFEKALNKDDKHDITRKSKDGAHRKRRASLLGYAALRTSYMSFLATQDVSIRDAMRIMAWESSEMIKVYERMLETYRGDADKRALKIVSKIKEFNLSVPDVKKVLEQPDKEQLQRLVDQYSNITIGKIYGVSEAAVRKWMDKSVLRTRRIESADISASEIERIRKELLR
jgi:site-specific recombinase XerD